jgi:hypothetical protein
LEFIESRRGRYPSTEGFLELLSSLFSVGGFPSYLGRNWRTRIGCTPYIEFVIDYVLPRVTGHFERHHPLVFRSVQDKLRLRTLALNVVDIVMTRYHIPDLKHPLNVLNNATLADDLFQGSRNALHLELGISDLAQAITIRPHSDDIDTLMSDFFHVTATRQIGEIQDTSNSLQYLSQSQKSVLPAKSPGFSTLVRMLSSDPQMLFEAIISPLINRNNIAYMSIDVDALSLAYALYVSTPPTFISAKDGARQTWPCYTKQSLLASLRPSSYTYDDIPIVEREVLAVLRILCGTFVKEEAFFRKTISLKGHATLVPVLRFTRKASLPITLNVQLSKLSYLLVSSNIDSGIVSSIISLIGFTSTRHQTMNEIAAMASAITFYIERSLSRKQSFELLSINNPRRLSGGLSESFTTRLSVSAFKSMLQSDSNLLLLILDRLLSELRAGCTFGSLTEVIFGEQITNLPATKGFGSVDAMLLLLDTTDFALGEYSAAVATLCYETLYRLISTSNGDKNVRISALIAEHLRARDFWSLEILKLCSAFQSLPKEKKSLTNYHVVQSIAWLFKGIACELRILAGTLNGNSAFLGVERLVASQPSLFKHLNNVLFSEQGLVSQALCVLPIERPRFTSMDEAPLDEKSVIAAKSELYGSPDVVHGYATINFDKLKNLSITHTVNEIGLRSWVEQWNLSVTMDCSSAHLSDAIRLVIETSLACSEDYGFDILSGQLEGRKTMFQILSCMTPLEDQMSNVESIDATFFTTACRNIALAACAVSLSIGDKWRLQNIKIDIEELATMCSLISRIIACSVVNNRFGAEFTRIKTRLSALAGVLIPIINAFPIQMLDDDNRNYFFQAAILIAELGVYVEVSSKLPITPSSEDLLLRSCLPVMLETLESSTKDDRFSPTRFVLSNATSSDATDSLIRRIFKLLSVFDCSVASLTQRLIFISPQVGELFISTGILEALKNAAVNYFTEEEKYLALLTRSFNYNNAQIEIPFFLEGHFDIMSALMTSKVSPKLLHDAVPKIVEILVAYTPIFDRLIRNFPISGDTLRSMLCCMAQANVVVNGEKNLKGEDSVFTKDQISTIINPNFSAFVSPVAKIVLHIAENPLPSQMLDQIPSRLSKPSMIPGIISLMETGTTSWWDKRKTGSTDTDFDTATVGMELLKCGALFLRLSDSQATLDEFSISRAICRCTDAASVSSIVISS